MSWIAPTLYTTHCPKCKVLEKKLELAEVEYITVTDTDKMLELGFMEAPMLVVTNEHGSFQLNFSEAVKWVNAKKG